MLTSKCNICSKLIDYNKYETMGEVKLYNWHCPITENNLTLTFCSDVCFNTNKGCPPMGCVVCNNWCKETKWFVECQFVKLGNWMSIKAACSEDCRLVIINEEAADIKLRKMCWNCKKYQKSMKICGKCKVAYYCSVDCQKSHWSFHKPTCK